MPPSSRYEEAHAAGPRVARAQPPRRQSLAISDKVALQGLVSFANGTGAASRYVRRRRAELRLWLRALAEGRPVLLRQDNGAPTVQPATAQDSGGGRIVVRAATDVLLEPWTSPVPDPEDYTDADADESWRAELSLVASVDHAFWRLINLWSEAPTDLLVPCSSCRGVILHLGGRRRTTCGARCEKAASDAGDANRRTLDDLSALQPRNRP